ncbi:MAG TPA: fatty acid desaturase [Terriglobia bacterium]|nr:fatty acid desaturase [Terriglobia bacterium]
MNPESITPAAVDLRSREGMLTLRAIRKVIPAECLHPHAVRSWWALIRVTGTVALSVIALSYLDATDGRALIWQAPAMAAVWIIYGWALVGLFVIGHDCGHESFSRRRWVNTLVGHLSMAPLANDFHAWKLSHTHHHAYTLLRGQEVDWASRLLTREEYEKPGTKPGWITRLGYALPFGVAIWIGWNMINRGFAMRTAIDPRTLAKERGRLITSSVIMSAMVLGIYGGLWSAFGVWGMLKFYGIPAAIAAATGSLIITIQHASEDSLIYDREEWTPLRGQMVSTFDVRFPRWMEWLWFDINTHIPHHLAPAIPWYHLKRAAPPLRKAFPDWYQERRFGWKHLAWWRRTPFLKKVAGKGYYTLDSRPAGPGASKARARWASRAVTVGAVLVAMGTLFVEPSGVWVYLADILLRTYAIFVGTVMAHEAVHGHMARDRKANSWWGRLALLPSMVPFGNFRKTHLLHHAFTNVPDKDPDYFVRHRHPIEIPFRALAMPHQWLLWLWRRGRVDRAHIRDLAFNYALIVAAYGSLLWFVSPMRLLVGMAPALFLVSMLLWHPFAYKTHEGFRTGDLGERSHNYYGRFMYWFSFGLSAHRTHHLQPQLTWLDLKASVEPDPEGGPLRRVFARRDRPAAAAS